MNIPVCNASSRSNTRRIRMVSLLVALLSALAPRGAAAWPGSIELAGIIRDFSETHPDFDPTLPGGNGHYAGDVNTWLPGNLRPLHVTGGFKVDAEWRDTESRPIAPHLAGTIGGMGTGVGLGIRVASTIEVKQQCVIDSFFSTRGPYGQSGNFGKAAYVSTNATGNGSIVVHSAAQAWGDVYCGAGGDPGTAISGSGYISGARAAQASDYMLPAIIVPSGDDLEGSSGDAIYDNVLVTLTGFIPADDDDEDLTKAIQFDEFTIKNDAVLTVEGDLRIVCGSLRVEKGARIDLAPAANLTLYVTGDEDLIIDEDVLINTPAGPVDEANTSIVTINYVPARTVKLEKRSHVYATIVAPSSELRIKNDAHLYGAFIGSALHLDDASGLHVDTSNGAMGSYNPAILVRDQIEFDDDCTADGFDSLIGPYDGPSGGGTNYGLDGLIQTNTTKNDRVKVKDDSVVDGDVLVGAGGSPAQVIKLENGGVINGDSGTLAAPLPIPMVAPPTIGASVGDREYKNETAVLSTNLHCKKLKIENAVLEIAGHVVVHCDDKLEMKSGAQIQLQPGGRLDLYVEKGVKLEDASLVNTTIGDPKLVSIRRMSLGKKGKIDIKHGSQLCAWVQGAKTEMHLDDGSEFFGTFMGDTIKIKKDSALHIDMAYLSNCVDVDDTAGTAGFVGSGGITSEATFDEWFHDVPGVNMSRVESLTLTNDGSGTFEYLSSVFRPINDELLGNEGDASNSHFTYAIAADFVYLDCGGQFIEFEGGDGAWIYVGGILVADLGGVDTSTTQHVQLDRLGLTADQAYRMHFFYANRHASSSTFNLRTNIELSTERVLPTFSAVFD